MQLKDERETFVIEIEFNEEEQGKEQNEQRLNHFLIEGIQYIFQDSKHLKILLGKNEIKDNNPYIILNKIIDKITFMYVLYKNQKRNAGYYPIVKSINFYWVCIDLELQFFEKPSSQHQIQIYDSFKARISNMLFTNIFNEINMRSQDDSMFQVQIIKKIDRDQARQNRQEQDEDYFFMNQVYNYNEQVMNQMINQIEQHCLILHILYFDINNESKYFMDDSWDFFFYRRNFKTIPSNKSLSLNIERIFQKYKNQYLYIQSNPFLIYKLMPFNITLTTQDCQECKHIGQCINHQIFLQNQYFALQQNPNAEQNKSQKEIIEKQLAELKLKLSKKEEIQTHTRSILMQINVTQELFQNQYQHDEKISQSIFGYWQNLYQLEAIFNPTRDQSLKMFESSEFPQIGSILQRKPHPIHIIKFSFTDYDRLEIFHKNLKYYSCQIQKILRQVYFMNLIGKDPNNIQSLNTNQPYFNFHVNEDLQNQQISVEIKRNELDFSMAIKNRFDDKSKVLTCQILYRQNDNKINDLFSSFMRLIFRSINNLEIDLIPIENQIRHITNIYSLVQQFFKNPEESFYKQLFQFIKQLDKFYFITDFSKKDMDIINIQEKGYKQPQYIFEVTSQFDFALFKPLRFNVKIYFGKSADNKIFVILEKSPNEVKIESIQTDDLTYYIQEFQKRISFQI